MDLSTQIEGLQTDLLANGAAVAVVILAMTGVIIGFRLIRKARS